MLEKLKQQFLFFDGAMGTMLQQRGLKAGEYPENYNISQPEIIQAIHRAYAQAGADIISTNTFGANQLKLADSPFGVEQVITAAVGLARAAIADWPDKYVALDIGPIGTLLEPLGTLRFEKAYALFQEQVQAGVAAGVDLILIETMSDLYEMKAAILAAKENSDLPVFCTMTFQADQRTFTGTDIVTMVNLIQSLGADVLGLNCSLGPAQLQPMVEEILRYSRVPVMVQANAGLPKSGRGLVAYDVGPEEYSEHIRQMAEQGALIFGGCCGTTPEYIATMREQLADLKPNPPIPEPLSACSSATRTVDFSSGTKVIGERINPTGKKALKAALQKSDLDYIVREAVRQRETGSDILDINVGLPDIDEAQMMVQVIKELQAIIPLPLQLDSASAKTIEAGLRVYNGKPIVNSVNGKASSMHTILPLVKKYGAMVIALTLDEDGIPSTAEQRVAIAEKIITTAASYGIPEEDILVDPLVLTASAEQANVLATLEAIPQIKAKHRAHIVLGASNVSFGLPQRQLLNTTYLAVALAYGLDAPITDSTNEALIGTIRAFRVLSNQDIGSEQYLAHYTQAVPQSVTTQVEAELDLATMIQKGLRGEAGPMTESLLQEYEPLEIVHQFIIPALDVVGEQFEQKQIFLPQLIRSAETAKQAFEVIKRFSLNQGETKTVAGKILLATVQGDIHDLGKNIVKLILENYGYEVIDLGKDVPVATVVERAQAEQVQLVGLSALMTTTVISMEDTIKALNQALPELKIMVGGAVLTPEYAEMIGADFFARDAREGVDIAKSVIQD